MTKSEWIERYGGQYLLDSEGLDVVPCVDCTDTICHGWKVIPHQTTYEVIVGNVGMVYVGTDRTVAVTTYRNYVSLSREQVGRAAGESVYLMEDGQPIEEHQGPADDEPDDE